ncbi:arylesterase [Roseicella frigidaeris]|uniref:Arylesterase n=1 Tax=Roseicella frigidaeris TaxID=2230885 RepID=A0A327MBN9_9PROT|nr:arylesterase [Roseicella frigidaeris]
MAPRDFRGAAGYGRRLVLGTALAGFGVLPRRGRAAAPPRLLVLGDSLAAGYGLPQDQGFVPQLQAALAARGRAVQVLNAGVSGDTTAGGLTRLDWALADAPQAVILELGGNDGLRALPPAASRANLAAILDRLKSRGIPVLLAGMLAPPNLGAAYGAEFAAVFQGLAREYPDTIFYPFFLEGVAGDAGLNQPDGIHPNGQGVAEIVRRILPAVETLLDRAVHPPD